MPPKLAWAMCFDGITGNHEDHVSIEGVNAGSACNIRTTPSAAHLAHQSTHLHIEPNKTGAIVTGHDFTPSGALILHLYHYFEGTWPVDFDFNFIEFVQGGNVIFALRVTNAGGGDARLYVVDATGGMTAVGPLNVIAKNTLHLIQAWLENAQSSALVVAVDHVEQLRTSGRDFHDSAGGDITVRIRNHNPSLPMANPTPTNCCGAYVFIDADPAKPGGEFETGHVIGMGKTITQNAGAGECAPDGSLPGDALHSGTSGDAGDWDNLSDAQYVPDLGGAWSVDHPAASAVTQDASRLGGTYNWLYSVYPNKVWGPANPRLLYGSTKEWPSAYDIQYADPPPGVGFMKHYQEVVDGDLSPLPALDEKAVIGFQAMGVDGEIQRIGLVEALVVGVYRYPFPAGPGFGGGGIVQGTAVLTAAGSRSLSPTTGKIQLYRYTGYCGDCCVPQVLAAATTNSSNPIWDLTPYRGDGVGPPCSFWRIIEVGSCYPYRSPWYGTGSIDYKGMLIGLPGQFESSYGYDGHMELQAGCITADGSAITWPGSCP